MCSMCGTLLIVMIQRRFVCLRYISNRFIYISLCEKNIIEINVFRNHSAFTLFKCIIIENNFIFFMKDNFMK